jgi:hypothetical protein
VVYASQRGHSMILAAARQLVDLRPLTGRQ